MNEHTKNFHVLIDSKGRPTVRILPGVETVETGEDVMFNKAELTEELTTLFKRAANTGWQIGKREIQTKFCDMMGVRRG